MSNWQFVNEPASGFFNLPELNAEVLNNIVNAVDGINDAGDIRPITFDDIGEFSATTKEVRNYFEAENTECVGRFSTLDVEASGWYAMKVTTTNELYDALKGRSVDDFNVYALTGKEALRG